MGPYGKLTRDYLQNTIPVHAEKPHHGHADEQSICALCSGGAVLLRDGAGAYVVIGIASFVVGVAVTVLCIRLKNKSTNRTERAEGIET